jgi:hypothetical protein
MLGEIVKGQDQAQENGHADARQQGLSLYCHPAERQWAAHSRRLPNPGSPPVISVCVPWPAASSPPTDMVVVAVSAVLACAADEPLGADAGATREAPAAAALSEFPNISARWRRVRLTTPTRRRQR